MSEIVKEKVSAFAEELLPSLGLELVEVQFRREQHGWVLRVFIDSEEGVNLDDCSRVSRELGDYLDVEDIIEHAYNLEVSSPGLERKLLKTRDFVRFKGSKAKIKFQQLYEGQKTYVGEILDVDGDEIVVLSEDGKKLRFTFAMLSAARLTL
jgi:ribosome maturation factor RimP